MATAATSTLSNVGGILNLSTSLTGVLGLAASFIIFHLGSSYINADALTPTFYAYAGTIVSMILTQLAAAYAIVQTIDASVHTTSGFFYLWRGGSFIGDYLGIFELISVLWFLTWAVAISVVGYIETNLLWAKLEDYQVKGATLTTT